MTPTMSPRDFRDTSQVTMVVALGLLLLGWSILTYSMGWGAGYATAVEERVVGK